MDELQKILKAFKEKLNKIKEIEDSFSKSDIDKIRTYIKYNEPLSHLEDASFTLRSFLEDGISSSLDEALESVDELIDGYDEYLGE